MKTTDHPTVFGLHQPGCRSANPERPALCGLHTLLFGSPNKPYVQRVAADGKNAGFIPLTPLAAKDYAPVFLPTTAQLGDPHLSACVFDGATPGEITVTAWPSMLRTVLEAYPAMRPALQKNPLAGHRLANFALATAPSYAMHSGGQELAGIEEYQIELAQLAADDDQHYRRSDEVKELLKRSRVDIRKHGGPPDLLP